MERKPELTPRQMEQLLKNYRTDMLMEGERTQDPTLQQKLPDEEFLALYGKPHIKGAAGKAVI